MRKGWTTQKPNSKFITPVNQTFAGPGMLGPNLIPSWYIAHDLN